MDGRPGFSWVVLDLNHPAGADGSKETVDEVQDGTVRKVADELLEPNKIQQVAFVSVAELRLGPSLDSNHQFRIKNGDTGLPVPRCRQPPLPVCRVPPPKVKILKERDSVFLMPLRGIYLGRNKTNYSMEYFIKMKVLVRDPPSGSPTVLGIG
jgi:hypothetical protein